MENQHNKKQDSSLLALRSEIDKIDDQIIHLLGQRMAVVHKVGELKKDNNETFFIKSGREADMIKDLVAKTDPKFPKTAIINIWRKIITAANMYEQPLNIAIHNPKNIADYAYLIREYYNVEVPLSFHDTVATIVLELERGDAQIGVFALPRTNSRDSNESDNWWVKLANNKLGIKVFAKIPFINIDNNRRIFDKVDLVAVAMKEAEASAEDNSLLYIEVSNEVSESKLVATLKEHNLEGKILKSTRSAQVEDMVFYLVELQGFYNQDNALLKQFSDSKIRPFVKVLGSYALPIDIE